VVNTDTLKDNPNFGKALAGIWYETMAIMSADTPAGKAARAAMGKASGTDLAGFDAQLKTTRMFYTPADALSFVRSAEPKATMAKVRGFLFKHNLLGDGAKSPDVIGIQFANGEVLGDKAKIKFRFTDTYMAAAAAGL
jgi:NitT/TauT family transport system substrate-binding protein